MFVLIVQIKKKNNGLASCDFVVQIFQNFTQFLNSIFLFNKSKDTFYNRLISSIKVDWF